MKKTQIIKEIVGKSLEPYGFKYLKTDGPCRVFLRELAGVKRYYDPENNVVKQFINIQESNMSRSLTVGYNTDVYGYEVERRLKQIKEYNIFGWVDYSDEDSYREKLHLLTNLIIQYALGELNDMSVEEEIIPTKAMAEILFEQHKQLDQTFIDEFHLKAIPEKVEDIDGWYQLVKELLIDSSEQPYENTKELILKITAFIGERACELLPGRWNFPEHFKTPSIVGGIPYASRMLLNYMVNAWKYKCDDQNWRWVEGIRDASKQGFLSHIDKA